MDYSRFGMSSTPAVPAVDTNKVLRNTYMLLAITMIPTVLGAFIGSSINLSFMAQSPIIASLVMMALMIGGLFVVSMLRNSIWGVVALLGVTFMAGLFMGPMLQHALNFKNGPQLIALAAGGTGAIFFTLATIATVTKKDFSFMGKFLFIGLVLLVLASLANLFFQIPALSLTISAIAVLLFSAYILYDVSQIVNGGETNYVMATMSLYLNVYQLFMNLLSLLLSFAGDRD